MVIGDIVVLSDIAGDIVVVGDIAGRGALSGIPGLRAL